MECQIGESSMQYETAGEGTPIIMLPGWGLSACNMMRMHEPAFEQIDGWQRIYPDLPGHGRTPASAGITNADGLLRVTLEFIEAVIPGQRFVVAGASYGAYLARGVAHHRAPMIDGLMMIVPCIEPDDTKRTLSQHAVLVKNPALGDALPPEGQEMWRSSVVVQSRAVFDLLRDGLAGPAEVSGDPEWLARIRDEPRNYSFSFDVDALPAPFPAPALFIAGRQDNTVGYADAWRLLERYPRATFAVLDCAGHFLATEQPVLFAALVREWLERVRAGQVTGAPG